jgi:hypothetical protein
VSEPVGARAVVVVDERDEIGTVGQRGTDGAIAREGDTAFPLSAK